MEWVTILKGAFDLSPAGLLLVLVVMYQRGEFVSRREHQETRADRDLARAESKEKDLVIRELVKQNAELLYGGKIAVEVSRALPAILRREASHSELPPPS